MESLYDSSRHRIQTLKEDHAKGLQPKPTKGRTVIEVLDSLQLLLLLLLRRHEIVNKI